MKFLKCAFLMLTCLTCLFANKTFAYSHDSYMDTFDNQFEKVSDDKYYVKPGSIFVSAEEIFLCCEGQLLPVTWVECDEGGVFIRSEAFKYGK